MVLIGVKGMGNRLLLEYASRNLPALVIDCANCADPHLVPYEALNSIYVMELELLYKFRDALKHAKQFATEKNVKCIVVTTMDRLFNYQDEEENRDLYEHAWELMRELAEIYPVLVAINEDAFAKEYCDEVVDGAHCIKPEASCPEYY